MCCPRLGMLMAVGYSGVLFWMLAEGRGLEPGGFDALAVFLAATIAFTLQLRHPIRGFESLSTVAVNLLGFVYIAFLFNFCARIVFVVPGEGDVPGAWLLLWLLAVTKFTDMGAYITGSLIGRHKMIPHVSPGKTWEGFGGAVSQPIAGAVILTGQTLAITAQVDARPTGSGTPVTATILNTGGTAVASGIVLVNDGTHGDAVANDAIWSNDGSDPAFPTYTIPLSQPTETGWTIRVFARDASTTTVGGGTNGHVKRNGLPTPAIEANYWNIDDSLFNIIRPVINITKISFVVSDPINGTSNPKAIPGALVRYCVTFSNPGTLAANNVIGTDNLPANVTYEAGTLRSGATCGTASTVEDDNNSGADETDPVGASMSGSTATLSMPTLAAGTSQSFTYDVRVVN